MKLVFRMASLSFLLAASVWAAPLQAQTIQVSGTVVDAEEDDPLIGASVKVKGTSQACATDMDGKFAFTGVASDAELEVSYVGYKTRTVRVNGKTTLEIKLTPDSELLGEVVVIGYGTMDKKELTSAISHISEKDFLKSTSLDASMMIQGKVSSVSITNTGAADPNNQASIQIRGVSSRSAGTGPLIVIDGIPGGNLTNINPNDIASFDVLKDGAAAAIYGTRGSNGVILVTTKRGARDGKIHSSYVGSVAASVANHELDMMTAKQYRALRIPGGYGNDLGGNDNWLDAVTRTGWTHQHTLTLNGGTETNNYRASLDYRKSDGVDLYSSREEYGGRASIYQTTRNGLFTFVANIAPRLIKRKNASWDVFRNALEINPTTPIMDQDNPGQYTPILGQSAGYNPVEMLALEDNRSETKLLDYDATVKLNLLPLFLKDSKNNQTLNTHLTFAGHESSNFDYWFRPSTSSLAMAQGYKGEGSRSYSKQSQIILEWLANYTGSFNGHNIKAMVGYSYQQIRDQSLSGSNKDFVNDGIGADNLGTGDWDKEEGHVGVGSWAEESKLISFFGRASYDWKGRYLLTVSLRHEGSSRFGKNHKWGNFPAVSAGWRISEEAFMKDVKWIDELKIRGDYGETGNQDFKNYQSLSTMAGFGYYYYNGQWLQVWGPGKNVNTDLHWEKAKNWNVGIDFALFDNRLSGSLNYYSRKQQDLLGDYNVPVPPYLHATTYVNVGTMKNSGFEFDIHVDAVRMKNFSYSIDFIGATMDNKFVKFSNSQYVGQEYEDMVSTSDPYPFYTLQRVQAGERVGNFYMWKYAGIDKDGNFMIYDRNGNIKPAANGNDDDKQIVGNGLPKFTASMSHNFRWRNWDLSIFLRGAFDYDIFNVHDFYYGTQSFTGNVLQKAYTKNARIKGKNVVTDYYLEKGDYVKLDMVSLGYTWQVKARFLESVKASFTAKNLATFTRYSGVDPSTVQTNGLTPGATGGRTYYPSCRQFIFGVQLDF